MKLKRLSVSLFSASLLTGCVGFQDLEFSQVGTCNVKTTTSVEEINWGDADLIKIEIERNKFYPSLIELRWKTPYKLSLINKDNKRHWFTARKFFQNTKIEKISIDGEDFVENCVSTVALYEKSTTTLQIIPLDTGIFDFEVAHPLNTTLTILMGTGATNTIYVNR